MELKASGSRDRRRAGMKDTIGREKVKAERQAWHRPGSGLTPEAKSPPRHVEAAELLSKACVPGSASFCKQELPRFAS